MDSCTSSLRTHALGTMEVTVEGDDETTRWKGKTNHDEDSKKTRTYSVYFSLMVQTVLSLLVLLEQKYKY
jgi:hypothetical protein